MKKIFKKEIFGLFLLLIGLLSFISIVGYDPSEQPSGLEKNEIINSLLGYFGVYVGYAHYFMMGYCSLSIPIIFYPAALYRFLCFWIGLRLISIDFYRNPMLLDRISMSFYRFQ